MSVLSALSGSVVFHRTHSDGGGNYYKSFRTVVNNIWCVTGKAPKSGLRSIGLLPILGTIQSNHFRDKKKLSYRKHTVQLLHNI